MAYAPPSPVDLAKVFESGQYSDLTIVCRETVFPVHQAIVCSQSTFFQEVVEKDFVTGLSDIIDLSDFDHDSEDISRMLSFLYNSQYPYPAGSLAVHVNLYAMGDIFNLPRLSKYAKSKFKDSLTRISDQKAFLRLIPRIYNSTPEPDRGLRDAAVWNARVNYDYYMNNLECKDAFHKVLQILSSRLSGYLNVLDQVGSLGLTRKSAQDFDPQTGDGVLEITKIASLLAENQSF
ncbi:MAG: hypothetical protein Q9195_003800 [Heterodermia aff. obscurata]